MSYNDVGKMYWEVNSGFLSMIAHIMNTDILIAGIPTDLSSPVSLFYAGKPLRHIEKRALGRVYRILASRP